MVRMEGYPLGSLCAKFMETNHAGHIHRYWTLIFGNYADYVSKPTNNDNSIP